MRGVGVEDVLRGVRIWETLPCRIRAIVVVLPADAALARLVRWVYGSVAPRKVRSKTRFVPAAQQHDDPGSEQRHVDGDAYVGAVGRDANVA